MILQYLLATLQPILVPTCFLLAWLLILLLGWTLVSATRDTVARAKHMHEIPCTNCRYFTNDYRLKCTVQPSIANTEKAISCSDYRPRKDRYAGSKA